LLHEPALRPARPLEDTNYRQYLNAFLDQLDADPVTRRALGAYCLTPADVAQAVCISEIAGSGHDSGEVPCADHDAAQVKVQRLYDSLADPERLVHYGAAEGDG
jgi:hypothetical protein